MKASLRAFDPFIRPVADRDEPGPRDVLAVRFQMTSATLTIAVMATALVVLYGWWFPAADFRRLFPGFVTMTVNTAIAVLLTAVALWLYRARKFSAVRDSTLTYCAGAAALIAFATTIEHLSGWNLHIDQILTPHAIGLLAPGRMALATAVCLMLVNAALLIADTPGRYSIAQAIIGGAIFLSTLNAVGYFFGLEAFSGFASYSAMGVHTSLCVLMLCLAFLFVRPDEGLMDAVIDAGAGGLVVRQLLPIVFFLPLMLAWLSWQGVRAGWYEPSFAMAVFVALTINVLSYAIWAGGHVLRGFENKRLAAEAERLHSEERLRRAVAGASVPMIIHDDANHILHMSQGWSDYSGYTLRETPTISDWIASAQADAEVQVRAHLQAAAASSDPVNAGEWTVRTRRGDERIWEFSTTPLGDLGSGRRAFVTMGVDITERKKAESDLRAMNEGLEQRIAERTGELTRANDSLRRQSDQLKEQATLLDLVRDGILVRDLFGTIVYWSAGAVDMYGWQPAEALGSVSHTILRAEYPKPLAEIEKHVIATGFWEGEVTHVTKAGGRVPVESRWTLTRTERGVPQGFLEVNRDIGARKIAEDSLRDSEKRFRAVAETAIEGIISVNEAGVVSYWNPGAERLFGRTASEAVGRSISGAIPAPALSTVGAAGAEPVVGTTFETAGLRRDGSEFPLELSLAAWDNAQGARFRTAIARDITDRKTAERALEAKAEELSRSNQELEQFAYVASHDLQEPLRMVSNYTQLLGRRYKDKLDSDAQEFIEFAVDGARRMQDLIHDLLQYARVGTRGKEFKPVPLDRVINDAIANLAGAIEEAKAQVAPAPMPTVACDASQLGQVFQNLIGNAIKFRRPDAQPIITVSAEKRGAVWTIAVKDNGIGIEPKYFERIFQMFQRLHGREAYPGTGIGLALCKKIVERHGGRISVASAAGEGTTFSFTIPDAPPKAEVKAR